MVNTLRPNLVGSPKIDFQSSEKKNKGNKVAVIRCIQDKKKKRYMEIFVRIFYTKLDTQHSNEA